MPESSEVAEHWHITCRSAQAHADLMAAGTRREAADLICNEARKFCERDAPTTQAELSQRQQQAMFLTARIASIAHADLMARNHPSVGDQILAETKRFLDRLDLDDSPYEESMALTSRISSLCHSDLMQRY